MQQSKSNMLSSARMVGKRNASDHKLPPEGYYSNLGYPALPNSKKPFKEADLTPQKVLERWAKKGVEEVYYEDLFVRGM